ncbi:hypothetical protein J437_LFUL011764 [Ladona fulva]|uniref:Proline-rich transmembrane protein 3/4 domain-containing protein n=1 Tax=Ladona fulva TaxID=123851 RepID=A0A8K0KC66_LADFU|nr:hypothetical protein J437_LFUL011764 [Ladona fulva]
MSTINGFLCLLGSSRAACLFIDPYNLRESMPKAIRSLLWDVGFPCLTSAFCLIQLAFLQLTQSGQLVPQHRLCQLSPSTTVYIVSPWTRAKKYVLNLGPEKLRRKSCLSLVITAHFTCLITTDVAATFHDQLAVGKLIVQVLFLLWGSFLSATFLYGGYKVMQLLKHGVPRRAGSSGASSTGGGCGGRLLPSEGSRGPLSPPPLSAHDGPMSPPLMLTAEEARAREAESHHKGEYNF